MNAAIIRMNWNCPPGAAPGLAAWAQASEIKPFMYVVRGAKRAALCHSTGPAPGGEEFPRPAGKSAVDDGGAERTQQADIEVQVVDGVEARTEDLVAAIQVAQVGAAVVAAGITV